MQQAIQCGMKLPQATSSVF